MKITLLGDVHPIAIRVNFGPRSGVAAENGWPFTLQIKESKLIATVEIPQFDSTTFTMAIDLIQHAANVPVNLLGFAHGVHLLVTIDEMIGPDGKGPLISVLPKLAALNSSVHRDSIPALWDLLSSDGVRWISWAGAPDASGIAGQFISATRPLAFDGEEDAARAAEDGFGDLLKIRPPKRKADHPGVCCGCALCLVSLQSRNQKRSLEIFIRNTPRPPRNGGTLFRIQGLFLEILGAPGRTARNQALGHKCVHTRKYPRRGRR